MKKNFLKFNTIWR